MRQTFPGFIDIHVHLRDPGSTHKEDFYSGSRAAIRGGFTFIIDMPNNPTPTFTLEALEDKITRSKQKALCEIGFHYGTDGTNLQTFPQAWENPHVFGLKVYCNETTGKYMVSNKDTLEAIFAAWKSDKPILAHVEGEMVPLVLDLAQHHDRHLHICHVATEADVQYIREAKQQNKKVSAGVCPHHLFLTMKDEAMLGNYALVKPPLGSAQDESALWGGLADGTIDLVESDHAPHTVAEKLSSPPSYGIPGLETTLGLLFRAVDEGKLEEKDVKKLIYENPKKIFSIPDQPDTYIECDPKEMYKIGEDGYESKSGWSPFKNWDAYGRVMTVVIKGKTILKEGKFL